MQTGLVHELTHALQDQRFDTREPAGDAEPAAATRPSPGGLRAVVEGDAQRSEDGLAEDPARKQRRAVDRAGPG